MKIQKWMYKNKTRKESRSELQLCIVQHAQRTELKENSKGALYDKQMGNIIFEVHGTQRDVRRKTMEEGKDQPEGHVAT